jgi:hypothetical protein
MKQNPGNKSQANRATPIPIISTSASVERKEKQQSSSERPKEPTARGFAEPIIETDDSQSTNASKQGGYNARDSSIKHATRINDKERMREIQERRRNRKGRQMT